MCWVSLLADGAVLWRYPWAGKGGGMQAITPIIFGETILISSYHMGVTALRPVRHDGKWIVNVAWHTDDVSMFLSNPVLIGDTLFGLSEKATGQFFALDAKTGKVLWLGKPRAATNTAVVKAGEFLFLLNDNAELIVAKSSRNAFEPIKTYTVADSATWAQPAITGNRIFIKDVSSLTLWTLNWNYCREAVYTREIQENCNIVYFPFNIAHAWHSLRLALPQTIDTWLSDRDALALHRAAPRRACAGARGRLPSQPNVFYIRIYRQRRV